MNLQYFYTIFIYVPLGAPQAKSPVPKKNRQEIYLLPVIIRKRLISG